MNAPGMLRRASIIGHATPPSGKAGPIPPPLRRKAEPSELSPDETVRRTLILVGEGDRFERLLKVAQSEPPRVRAMLGALGEQLGKSPKALHRLRESLNALSRFDFGRLAGLTYARNWQAKERRPRATV